MKILLPFLCAVLLLADTNSSANLDANSTNKDKNSSAEQNLSAPKFQVIKPIIPPDDFTSQLFSLPSNAKVIEQIVVRYSDENGATQEKIIDINRSVDWRDDFMLSARAKPALSKILDVSVTSNDPNLEQNGGISMPKPYFTPRLDLPLETIKFDDKLQFVIKNHNLEIITKDEIKSLDTNKSKFAKIELFRDEMKLSQAGFMVNVGGFYDINITRDEGFYTLEISGESNASFENFANGYIIKLK
ncbi:hypothetical protein OFN97_03470 [Campylobacter sp. VBCF_05 NA6]|uniref:hypothetical protein n=1 Tax=unclassified Campylobacter TaxID=2593542 RepID=UPI0022E9A5B6|nr:MULTISPECIES: hypothetical protein [unclassified Campylobacter]MDA3057351.1 hypothetical protein [Campylobacter sp. VBCF_04 NA7]MDA3059077.1 hypothetical protein [Campylobacter sp. VBCF_05 NA6]